MASVELQRVSKVFSRGTAVLDQIDLFVDDGEMLVLLGPNGSGKTTLLRLIAGLESPTWGEIRFNGQRANEWPPRQRNVAMMFQSAVLYPHLTVKQNLMFGTSRSSGVLRWIAARVGLRLASFFCSDRVGRRADGQAHGRDRGLLEDRVRETAQRLGIESLLDRLPRHLSGGERQRVALGRVLVRQPAVFLLDEPLASADIRLRRELRAAFQQKRWQYPGTMIVVSHDQSETLAMGNRIAILADGKIQQIGPASEVYFAPRSRFVAEFMSRSGMSFVTGMWRQEQGDTIFVSNYGRLSVPASIASSVPRSSERVCLGWRADAAVVRQDRSEAGWLGTVTSLELREEGTLAWVALQRTVYKRDNRTSENGTSENGTSENEINGIVMARVTPLEAIRPGESVHVEIDVSRAFWFDTSSGKNLAVLP